MTVRVVLTDDQPLVRAALQMVITDSADIEVVGEAGNGSEAVEVAEHQRPDVVVMDIRMPGLDGIEATRLDHPARPRHPCDRADHLRRRRLRLRRTARRRLRPT